MPELIAAGPAEQQWKQTLPESQTVRIGRAPRAGWNVPWDMQISREHVDVEFAGGKLQVRVLESARNPVLVDGEPATQFQLGFGQSFLIGETTFTLVGVEATDDMPAGVKEYTFSPDELRKVQFGAGEKRLEALAQLPRLIGETTSDADFATRIVELLLFWLPKSEAAAVAQYDLKIDPSLKQPTFMRWDSRGDVGRFTPSRRLMKSALESGQSKIHSWSQEGKNNQAFTMSEGLDWAFCTPILQPGSSGWCLYVSGKGAMSMEDLAGDLRFTELLAQFIGAIRRVRTLEHKQTEMSRFFSPAVMETLVDEDSAKTLEPREDMVTVLFCDVRGFSKKVEQAKRDLHGVLKQMSDALGVMTQNILKHEGVIADFQGDAALGFWGWPSQPGDGPLPACRAALSIAAEFAGANSRPDHSLTGFGVGMGIGYGRAIAGQIGTKEQIKVGVFGQTVNQASRLESLTRQLGVVVVLDDAAADYVRQHMPPEEGRARRLVRVRPKGMDTPVTVNELLPGAGSNLLSNDEIAQYESALDLVISGDWEKAGKILAPLVDKDAPAMFLKRVMAELNNKPPAQWDGAFTLKAK